MSSIKCPQCGMVNFAADSTCKRCSLSLTTAPPANIGNYQPAPQPPPVVQASDCQRCGSAETRTFEMAYMSNTSSGTLVAGSYNGDIGMTFTGGVIKQQSNLAVRVQPPVFRGFGTGKVLAAVFVTLFISMILCFVLIENDFALIGFLLLVGLPTGAATLTYKVERNQTELNQKHYARALAQWQRSWICMRCGQAWIA